jgi:hypothetical protein
MPSLQPIFLKAYWTLAIAGILWATFILSLINPTIQRHALYAHKIWPPFGGGNASNPEEFGFAKGQVQPFWLDTTDGERLFCWHVLPLDVYLENEQELVREVTSGEIVWGMEGTVGARLLKQDATSRVVINFHGVRFWSLFSSCFPFQWRFSSLSHIITYFNFLIYCPLNCRHFFMLLPSPLFSSEASVPSLNHAISLTNYLSISSNTAPERRPHRPRPPTLHLPLHLQHPLRPPPNLRLPRLRPLIPHKRPLHPHRKRLNYRRHLPLNLRPSIGRPNHQDGLTRPITRNGRYGCCRAVGC